MSDKLRWANWRARAVLPLGVGALLLFFVPASASAASSPSTTCAGNNPTENTGSSPGPTPNTATGHDTCHEVA